MSTKTKNGLIVAVIVLAIGAGAYLHFHKKKLAKGDKVQFIILSPNTQVSQNGLPYVKTFSFYMKLDDAFIDAWYQAIQEGKTEFIDIAKGNVISVLTGTAIRKA
jgi:hypothetical protein